MSFTARMKEEMSNLNFSDVDTRCELAAFLRYNAKITNDSITLLMENGSVARKIYRDLKKVYNPEIKIVFRTQKRFRIKQIYILKILSKQDYILTDLNIITDHKKQIVLDYLIESKEDKINFISGLFLASGSISDPAKSGYHLEFVFKLKKEAFFCEHLLKDLGFNFKLLKRSHVYMIYLKEAEAISDIIKMFGATNSLFYFEDIRIYRDHKNMVNRLNNCEIANQEKTIATGLKQVADIEKLEKNNLVDLLDDNTKIVIEYRKKYPETSYQELADIISLETEYKIGKSGINHHFIKIKKLLEKVPK